MAIAEGCQVIVYDTDGVAQWSAAPLPKAATGIVSAQGGRLWAVSLASQVRYFMPMRRAPVAVHEFGDAADGLSLSIDSHWAVCSTHQRKTLLWETHRPATRPVECAHSSGRHAPAFRKSGRKQAVPAERHLPLWSIGPRSPAGWTTLPVCASALAWQPGAGDTLATAGSDDTVRPWRAGPGSQWGSCTSLAAGRLTSPATSLAWIGRHMLAAAERGGRITLLDVSGDTPPRPGG
ncbi:hypothetical protein ACIGW8_09880 [Streptomyces sioyaensis]|uniref:hypothetical protein n=1 Tax=Streptomyces sioyaensis TaxID=67364 RepID=UPI0037CD03DB